MREGVQLTTEAGNIDLPGKTKITYEQNSPFFDRENLRNSFTSTFKISGSNGNDKKFNFPHLLESADDDTAKKISVGLLSDGVNIANGMLLVNESRGNLNKQESSFNTMFVDELSKYADAIEGKTLKDLQLFGEIFIAGDDITDIDSATGNNIRGRKTSEWAENIVMNGHDYLCFPSCKVDDEFYDWANLWDDIAEEMIVPVVGPILVGGGNRVNLYATIIPMIYYHQILKHCFTEFGYTIKGDFLNNTYFKKHVVINNHSPLVQRVNTLLNLDTGAPENAQYTELDTTVIANNHVPEIDIKEFLNDFMIRFGAAFRVVGTQVEVILMEGKTVAKSNAKQTPNYIKSKADKKLVRLYYEYSDEEKEQYPTEIIADFEQGKELELNPVLRPVWQGEQRPFINSNKIFAPHIRTGVTKAPVENCIAALNFPFTLPATAPLASLVYVNTEEWECPKEIGIYHGLLSTVSAKVSPYMSHDNLRHNIANDVIGDWSLVWQNDDEYGLVDVFLKHWLRILNSSEKRIFYFQDDYLEYLENDWENFKIIGNQEYYIAKKRAQLPLRKEVEYECYKV